MFLVSFQIKHIKEQEAAATIDAVQQGEVSSSKPTILTSEVFGPLLLEVYIFHPFLINFFPTNSCPPLKF